MYYNIKIFNQFYFYKFYVNNIASSNMYIPLNITLQTSIILISLTFLHYYLQFNTTKQEIQFYHFGNSHYT